MSSEPFVKVGRGGAGNIYTQGVLDAAPKAQHEDLEAQKLPSPDDDDSRQPPPLSSILSPTTASRTGRGGAGNYVAPSDLDESDPSGQSIVAKTREGVTHTKERVREKLSSSRNTGYGGRGGAGNFKGWEDEDASKIEREEVARREIEEKARGDVDGGLSRPPGAYLGSDKEWSG